jgi:ADP-heptose:LPS heptosyltransferase
VHETRTNYEIIKPLLNDIPYESPKLYAGSESEQTIKNWLEKRIIEKYAVFHVSARRELRRWNAGGFIAVATGLYNNYGLLPIFTGTVEEEVQIQAVTNKLEIPYFIFSEGFDLSDLTALIQRAEIFIGNESGPLQMADAIDIPLVGLFGPGVINVFYPQSARSAKVHHVLDCNPCDQIHCVRPENPCIDLITIAEVNEAVDSVLSKLQ